MTRSACFMPLLLGLLLLAYPVAVSALSDSKRLELAQSLRDRSRSGLIVISLDNFQKLAEDAPRSYDILVMISAPPDICRPCGEMSRQLALVAKEYYQLSKTRASSKPLFFVEVKVTMEDQNFIQSYGLRRVPILYFFAAGSSRSYPTELKEQSMNNYPIQSQGFGSNAMKEFVNKKTGARMKIVRGDYAIPFVKTVKTFMPVILFFAAFAGVIVVVTGAYKSPMLWYGLVVLVYIFSVGGGHFSWIHDTPLAMVNKEGRMVYIASGSRNQYVAEGFFVSVTCVSISVLVILIQELPSVMPSKAGQTAIGMCLVFLTAIAISALLATYNLKMPEYLHYSEI